MESTDCPRCEGTGFVLRDDEGLGGVSPCPCEERPPRVADLPDLGMPRRYLHCTLDSYRPVTPNQRKALGLARDFVESWPMADRGILFTGPCGVGKTHLAAAMLRHLVLERGVRARFADYQDLLKRIQATYSRQPGGATEEQVLAPVLEADMLVLDDLGSRQSTAWAEETIGHLLNVRYNEARLTIITTNLLDLDPALVARDEVPGDNVLLAERVSERVLSRLHEMCHRVHVEGPDHRRRGDGRHAATTAGG